jgi:phage head maturation protease
MRAKTNPKNPLVRQSSFAFTIEQDGEVWSRENGVDVRSIRSVRLHDVSMVTRGVYSSSTVGMRSVEHVDDAKASYEKHQTQLREQIVAKLKESVTLG